MAFKIIKKRRSEKTGLPPGSLVYIGEKKVDEVKIRVFNYSETEFQEKSLKNIEECFPFKDKPGFTWININGIHDTQIIEKIGKHFGVHSLVLEDIMNTEQRPKIEDFGDYMYIVLKMLYYNELKAEVESEQVSIVLGQNFLISFQEKDGDVFSSIRERIKNSNSRIRKMGIDYLAQALMDAIVDNYFLILEKLGEKIEYLESGLTFTPGRETLEMIHSLKREMIFLRNSVWPLREVLSILERGESQLIKKNTRIYFRDVYDHAIQVIDTVEIYREMASGMLDIYLSSVSNRTNEVMKVLTIIATIFIPLTFIVGIYGMNFEHMPELGWKWGYPVTILVMLIISIMMLLHFRRRKWI